MRYIHLFNDDDGRARFEDVDIPLAEADFAPPAPPLDVSDASPVREVLFISPQGAYRLDPLRSSCSRAPQLAKTVSKKSKTTSSRRLCAAGSQCQSAPSSAVKFRICFSQVRASKNSCA